MPRLLGANAHGVHPSKLLPLTWPRLAVAFGTRAVSRKNLTVVPRSLPAYRCRPCNLRINSWALHFQLGFRALLPLRIRQSPAVLTPRTIRCSPGFRLSKDFPLLAPSPPSRAFHSRTCAVVDLATECRAVPQRLTLRGGQLALARLSISIEPLRSGRCPF
jgi:hypothetical protein